MSIAPTSNPAPARVRAPVTQNSAQPSTADWMKTGAQAREILAEEQAEAARRAEQRARDRLVPYRLYLKPGEQTEVVILDAEPGPCWHEHELRGSDGLPIYESCPKLWEPCPLCEGSAGAKPSYLAMFMTVKELKPYVNRDGVKISDFQYRLYVVKQGQHDYFHRLYKDRGTLRGVQLRLIRDADQRSPKTGTPEFVSIHSEADILASFGHPPIVSRTTGKQIKPANAECYPINYAELFPKPSAADLRRRYGGVAPLGSAEYNAQALGSPAPSTGGIRPIAPTASVAAADASPAAPATDQWQGNAPSVRPAIAATPAAGAPRVRHAVPRPAPEPTGEGHIGAEMPSEEVAGTDIPF